MLDWLAEYSTDLLGFTCVNQDINEPNKAVRSDPSDKEPFSFSFTLLSWSDQLLSAYATLKIAGKNWFSLRRDLK